VIGNKGRTQLVNKPVISSDTSETSFSRSSVSYAWRALRHYNFKLFFFGQSISVIGNWMTRLATTWLVYHLTHSALLLGIVSFSGQIVSVASSLWFSLELPKLRVAMRPIYREKGSLPTHDLDLITDEPKSVI